MDASQQPTAADVRPNAEKSVTVTIVVHNPAHMKYMSKIGIYLLYYCKECPYNSQALLDVTTHVAATHETDLELPENSTPLTEPVIEISQPKRQEHNYSTKTESHKNNMETLESSFPVVVFPQKSESIGSATNVMTKVKVPKLKNFSPQTRASSNEEMVDSDSEAVDIEPVDLNFVPRDFFCPKCPYTVMYSAIEKEQHMLCHGAFNQAPCMNDGRSSINQVSRHLTCYMCRPGRGKNMLTGGEVTERSRGQVWHHLKEHLHLRHYIDYKIKCKLCDMIFKSHMAFKTHRATHRIKCKHRFCKYTSVSVSDMTTHQKCHVVGDEKKFMCHLCGHQCKRDPGKWSVLHAHLVARHAGTIEPLYRCHKCPKGFQCLRPYRNHLRSCRKIGNLICSLCNQEIHPDLLPAHLKTHVKEEEDEGDPIQSPEHPVKNIEVCDEVEADSLLPGSNDETSGILYLCSEHKTVFPTKEKFTEHLTSDHNGAELREDAKEDQVAVKETVQNNMHEISVSRYKCKICYKKFQSESRLLRHVSRIHSKESDSVSCTQCSRQFKNKIRLRNHVREVHEGQKRRKIVHAKRDKPVQYHICETCGYTTPSTLRLRNHQLSVHQGIIPYHCDKCDFKTSEKSDFYRHKWHHSGSKKYSCTNCSYKTNTRWVMVNHAWKQHGVQLPKKSKDTMGCIWSKRWQDKLRKMTPVSARVPQNTLEENDQHESLYLPSEMLTKDDEEVNIPESYLQTIKLEDQVVSHELVNQNDIVSHEIIQDGSVFFDPSSMDVREVIVDPSSEIGDNVVYIPDSDLTEATEAALLLLAVGPNQTLTE